MARADAAPDHSPVSRSGGVGTARLHDRGLAARYGRRRAVAGPDSTADGRGGGFDSVRRFAAGRTEGDRDVPADEGGYCWSRREHELLRLSTLRARGGYLLPGRG